jgi:hypothetical protein
MSDPHVDYKDNLALLEDISATEFVNDALVLAGDVTHSLALLETTLVMLRSKFAAVAFVPGNHDVWTNYDDKVIADSISKFDAVLAVCRRIGIITTATRLPLMTPASSSSSSSSLSSSSSETKFVWFVPLFAWYDRKFMSPYETGTTTSARNHVLDEPNSQ